MHHIYFSFFSLTKSVLPHFVSKTPFSFPFLFQYFSAHNFLLLDICIYLVLQRKYSIRFLIMRHHGDLVFVSSTTCKVRRFKFFTSLLRIYILIS